MSTSSSFLTARRSPLAALVAAALAAALAMPATAARPRKPLPPPENEADLAKTPDPYLVVDRGRSTLEVKVRGLTLESIPLGEAAFLAFQPLRNASQPPRLALPAIWTVQEAPPAPYRAIIAPAVLIEGGGEEEEEVPQTAEAREAPLPPDHYEVPLQGGWVLAVGLVAPREGLLGRWTGAVADGWRTLRGNPPARPPRIVLVLDPADAQRLHHLFRAGFHVLIR